MSVPRLKSLTCLGGPDRLIVSHDPRWQVELSDPDGQVRALLELLSEGSRDAGGLHREMAARWPEVTRADVDDALRMFDELGWLENAVARNRLDAQRRERYFSNLAFFDMFSSLDRSREDIQATLLAAHVVVLGTGGLGSSVVQNLAGLGIGQLTLLDADTVAMRNLVRQFTYDESRVGLSKVTEVAAWVRGFNSGVQVRAVHERVTGPNTVRPLLAGADLLISAIDQPIEVDLWVNEACVESGVPFIRGGLVYSRGLYWSVDPGRSACRQCLAAFRATPAGGADPERDAWPRILEAQPVNRGIGPVATIIGGLMAMEAVRYLSGIVPPVSAGTYQLVDFAADCGITADPWPADPDCPICRRAPSRVGGLAGRHVPASPRELAVAR
jgi:molybdopterin/thiamine biosynthesis adenylyltransferase